MNLISPLSVGGFLVCDIISDMPNSITVDGEVYDQVADEVRIGIEHLLRVKDKIGIPEDAVVQEKNDVLVRYAFEIYRVWAGLYPEEHKQFIENTEFELKYERPVKDAIKAGGYSPMSYPMRLDRMFSVLLPKVKTQDKRFWRPLLKNIPELRRTNYL